MDEESAACPRAVICVANITLAGCSMLVSVNHAVFMSHGDVLYPPLVLIS